MKLCTRIKKSKRLETIFNCSVTRQQQFFWKKQRGNIRSQMSEWKIYFKETAQQSFVHAISTFILLFVGKVSLIIISSFMLVFSILLMLRYLHFQPCFDAAWTSDSKIKYDQIIALVKHLNFSLSHNLHVIILFFPSHVCVSVSLIFPLSPECSVCTRDTSIHFLD